MNKYGFMLQQDDTGLFYLVWDEEKSKLYKVRAKAGIDLSSQRQILFQGTSDFLQTVTRQYVI